MKKLFSTFCALILVLSLVLVGCGNEIGKADGTYDAISSKQRTAYVKKLDSLRDVLGKTSLKTVATVTSEYEEDEDEDAADVQKCVTTRTLIADCTDPDNPKVYESLTIRFVMADGDHEVSIKAYYDERGSYLIDPQAFIDYYEARGWMLNKNRKMVDWKAAVRTWENNEKERQRKERQLYEDLPF